MVWRHWHINYEIKYPQKHFSIDENWYPQYYIYEHLGTVLIRSNDMKTYTSLTLIYNLTIKEEKT